MSRSPFMSKISQIHSSSLKFKYSINSGANSARFSGQPFKTTSLDRDNTGSLSVSLSLPFVCFILRDLD